MKVLRKMIIVSSSCDVFCVFLKKAYGPVLNLWWWGLAFLALMKRVFVKWCCWSSFFFFRTCWILCCECKICLIRPLGQALAVSLSLNCSSRTETFITALECLINFCEASLKCIWLRVRDSRHACVIISAADSEMNTIMWQCWKIVSRISLG